MGKLVPSPQPASLIITDTSVLTGPSLCTLSPCYSLNSQRMPGSRLPDCTSYRVVVSGFPKTAAPIYISPRIYQCPVDADHVSSLVNSDILFAGVRDIKLGVLISI